MVAYKSMVRFMESSRRVYKADKFDEEISAEQNTCTLGYFLAHSLFINNIFSSKWNYNIIRLSNWILYRSVLYSGDRWVSVRISYRKKSFN